MGARLKIHSRRLDHAYTVWVDAESVTIGRAAASDVCLPFEVVSSAHLRLSRSENRWEVEDVGSTNGTLVDGAPLRAHTPRRLHPGSSIAIGHVEITFTSDDLRHESDFTLAETGTLARRLLSAPEHFENASGARLDFTEGPGAGSRLELPDTLNERILGGPEGMKLIGLNQAALRILRIDAHFFVEALGDSPVTVNESPLSGRRALRSGDVVKVGEHSLRFNDPLEQHLGVAPLAAPHTSVDDSPTEEPKNETSRADGAARWVILVALFGVMLAGAMILLVLFEVV